jgi:hypothetical protein
MKALSILTVGLFGGLIGLSSATALAIDCDKSDDGNQICLSLPDEAPQASKQEASNDAVKPADKAVDRQMLSGEVSGGALTPENNLNLFSALNMANAGEIDENATTLSGLADALRAQDQLASIDLFLRGPGQGSLSNSLVTTSSKH